MPVILNQDEQAAWLDHSHYDKDELKSLLAPCPDDELTKHPVTPKINKASFEGKDAIQPIGI